MLFNIKGVWNRGGEEESFEFATDGSVARNGEEYTLKYNEASITGEEGDLVTITVSNGSVMMHKTGAMMTQMFFEEGKPYASIVETPFGNLSMSFMPTLVAANVGADAGRINLEYILNIEGEHALNRLDLSYGRPSAQAY